jgi:threonylcarbamoyladenosine tRNA methylthiotransferase MtaB
MRKFAFYTLGCKANQYQTEVLKSQVAGDNSQVVDFPSRADTYIINTCTVTQDADRKSRQAIRRAIKQNPKAKIIVTGCYAKLQAKQLKAMFPNIEIEHPVSLFPIPHSLSPRIRANLLIQDGCKHFCSYCIVPYARGKIKSKPLEQAIEEAKRLVEAGAREIVLTGINLGTYQFNLSAVIERLSMIKDLHRIRLSSLEPMYLEKELIDGAAWNPKVCKHLHIPLQSGDNNILKAMNRNYSRDEYLDLIQYIRNKMPDCGITTDIVAGFPGEGEREFQNTIDLINQIKFSRLHIFSYSKREGTPAADLPNQVDPKTKKQRSQALQELRVKYMTEFANQYLNKEVEILAEQKGEGLTPNYIRCFFNDPTDSSGSLKIISAKSVTDAGEIRG